MVVHHSPADKYGCSSNFLRRTNHYIISEYMVLPLHHMTSFGTVGLGTLCQANNHNLGALEMKPTVIAGHEDTTPPKK